jgi:predicted dehydrogenase
VLVEKPLVTTLNEADRLVMIAERYANRVLYAENLAYAPTFRKWVTQIANMGTVQHLSVRMEQGAPGWGDFLDPQWGGGVLFDLGVHPLALMVLSARACGAGEVVSVSAALDGDTTDEHAEVTLTFSEGLSARVTVSWRGSDTPHWSLQAASQSAALTLELMPDITLERNGDPIPLAAPMTQPPMIESLGYLDQLRAFRADLAEGATPWMDVSFGRWIMEIVCACYVSARDDGRETPVPSGCDRTLTPWQLWRG